MGDGRKDDDEETHEDGVITGKELWITKSTGSVPRHSVAYVKSTIWPGAATFAKDEEFESIYIGFGIKFNVDNFSPEKLPEFQQEADLQTNQKDCAEMTDPTVEEETQLRERMADNEMGEESEEEEEGEGEEEEED